MTERLRRLERLLRPGAPALRAQAAATAEGRALLGALREDVVAARAELDEARRHATGAHDHAAAAHTLADAAHQQVLALRDLVVALHQRVDAVEGLLLEVAATVGAIDRRNVDYDRWTEQIIARTLGPSDTGIDVGAHAGLILRAIVAAAPDGRHHAFEPIPSLAAGLRRDFPGVEVHEVALSDAEGTAEFHHVTSDPSYSGLRRRIDAGDDDVEVITVRTARLDEVVDASEPVRLLKIDVEGGELGVLRGAAALLAAHRPVTVFEMGKWASRAYGAAARDVHDLFAGHDMAISTLEAHLAGGPPLGLDQLEDLYETGEHYYFVAHARS